MYSYLCRGFQKTVAADVRSILPVNLNEVGKKAYLEPFLSSKKYQI